MEPRRLKIVSALRIAVWGLASSVVALVIDAVLIRVTVGVWIEPSRMLVLAHAGLGLVLTLAFTILLVAVPALGRVREPGLWAFSLGLPIVYGTAIWERFCHFGRIDAWWSAVLVAGLVLVLLGVALLVYTKIAAARQRGWFGALVVGVLLAVVLSGNRSVVEKPLAAGSLLFDLVCVVLSVALLVALRDRCKGRSKLIQVGALLGLLVMFGMVGLAGCRWWLDSRASAQHSEHTGNGPTTNVLVLVFDTMRGDVFYDVLENTPEGRDFQRALGSMTWFSQATSTGPSTPPTTSTIFSGLFPPQHGIDGSAKGSNWKLRVRRDVTLLAERLSREGYQTLAFVANRALKGSIGIDRGFERFFGLRVPAGLYPLGPPLKTVLGSAGRPHVPGDVARRMLVSGLQRLSAKERPTLLWFHLMDTHQTLVDHPELPPTAADANLTAAQLQYRNAARFAQQQVALALPEIRAYLPREETITVVLADHGEMLAEDGNSAPGSGVKRGHGRAFFESIVHIPMGVQLPAGQPTTRRSDLLVSQVDVLPTIYDVLGLDADRELPGCSLLPWVRDPEATGRCRDFAVSSAVPGQPGHWALRTPSLKVMYSNDNVFPTRLYELEVDPGERQDMALDKPEAVRASVALLRQFWLQFDGETSGEPAQLDQETVEKLKALGYLQ